MKIVKLCVLFITCLYQNFLLIPQELHVTSTIEHAIDSPLVQCVDLSDSFEFLQSQGLINQSFQNFVVENLAQDCRDNEEQNTKFKELIEQARGLVSDRFKHGFFSAMNLIIDSDEDLDQIQDPMFMYVMSHKDDFMKPMMRAWVEEWEKKFDEDGFPLLNWCLNHAGIAKLLVDVKADFNMQDTTGWAPLHYAAFKNCPKNVLMYLNAGADINIQNDKKSTPLHIAAWQNNIDIVQMLIKQGADLNIQDCQGNTPLYTTEYRGVINILIAAGAALHHRDLIENGTSGLNYRQFAYHAIRNARDNQHSLGYKKKQTALPAKIRELITYKNSHCVLS